LTAKNPAPTSTTSVKTMPIMKLPINLICVRYLLQALSFKWGVLANSKGLLKLCEAHDGILFLRGIRILVDFGRRIACTKSLVMPQLERKCAGLTDIRHH
jgi:hypothetical protein